MTFSSNAPRFRWAWASALALLGVLTSAPMVRAEEEVLSWEAAVEPAVVPAGERAEIRLTVSLHGKWHINAAKPGDPTLIPTRLTLGGGDALVLGLPQYPEPHEQKFEFADEPLLVYQGKFEIRVPVEIDPTAADGAHEVQGKLRYQACDNTRCLGPRNASITLTVTVGPPPAGDGDDAGVAPTDRGASLAPGGAGSEPPPATSAGAESGLLSAERLGSLFENRLIAYGVVFLIGLGLNLTPCVYPVIPITVGFFANQASRRAAHTLALAFVYFLGMAMMYTSLGAFAALSGKRFGWILQSKGVLLGEAAIMVALATSMFGLWDIGVPSWVSRKLGASPTGLGGALFMGLTVGVIAAPCLAPAVLGLFTFVADQQSVSLGVSIFFALSCGLGLPYVVLAFASGSMIKLPRSGEWMLWIKHLFGFALVGMALYFLRPLLGDGFFAYGLVLLSVAAAIFLGFIDRTGDRMSGFRRVKQATGVVLGALAVAGLLGMRPAAEAGEHIAWIDYDAALFEAALASSRPTIVDFTATWCLPCKEFEKHTFPDPAVVREAARFTAFRVDGTFDVEDKPELKALHDRFGVIGYPTILFIDSKGQEKKDLRVVGFTEAAPFAERLAAVR